MRSSKSRSRSKQNRSRSVGNVINRVFDSSGPEGKVRGTPQQIIDKYNQLARDAQLSNDRVAAENFQQHSEHYTRMLSEAMREMEAQRQANQNESGNQGGGQNNQQNGNGGGNQQGGGQNRNDRNRDDQGRNDRNRDDQNRSERSRDDNARGERNEQPKLREDRDDRPARDDRKRRDDLVEQPAVEPELPAFLTQSAPAPARAEGQVDSLAVDDGPAAETDSGLVETPESAAPTAKPKPKTTRARKPKAKPPEAAE
ncbi:DUF4167 domain-containing protein [Frigidibacter sp. ROC022]|uniref:DUF4167 domain-containing protein n=1 Tax=Frigidibacter sp. ROC022 TaxID=2971796 RepID=UPI00215A7C19|nr:DUF4167 domain-containing protein [Frigidibacter sp. ROC022]MCR8726351.1 DUF4167 domain-containing protein [Frigidibacter sp. ROC022]